jgi:putative transposase
MTWSRREALATAPPIATWMSVDTSIPNDCDEFNGARAEDILNRVMAIRLLMAGKTYREVTQATGICRSTVTALLKKCLSIADDGQIQGFRALIPYIHLSRNVRRSPLLPKRKQQKGGMSCALAYVLASYPDLEDDLLRTLDRKRGDRSARDFNIQGMTLVRLFYAKLKRRGVGDNEWPFTPEYRGKRTIEKYMKGLLQGRSFAQAVRNTGGHEALAHLPTGTGHMPMIPYAEPFDAVEIDAYHIDAFFTVVFGTPEGTSTDVILDRLWLLAIVERLSTAVLAYKIVYSSEVSASDVASLIRDSICKVWQPKALTNRAFEYLPTGGLPSGVIPEARHAVWNVTLLDGALANLAKRIHDEVRKSTGFVMIWGAPGHFEHRPNVERTFLKIAENVFHQFPSTTGSNPRSGRARDPEAAAKKHRIYADKTEELVDVYFAEHNGTPGERNSFNSPLETLRYFICGESPRTMVRTLPHGDNEKPRLARRTKKVPVRGSIARGRRPYIQYESVHYTNPLLGDSKWLLGKEITIHVDDDDLRQVSAFLPNGAELGVLVATGKWGVTKHDIKTRKAIFRLVYKRILILSETIDPVLAFLDLLANKRGGRIIDKRDATDAVRVAKEAGVQPHIGPSKSVISDAESEESLDEPIDDGQKLSILPPIPEDLFKVKNR